MGGAIADYEVAPFVVVNYAVDEVVSVATRGTDNEPVLAFGVLQVCSSHDFFSPKAECDVINEALMYIVTTGDTETVKGVDRVCPDPSFTLPGAGNGGSTPGEVAWGVLFGA